MFKPDKITIHCADTPEGVYFDTSDIRQWHKKRGFKDVGYHFIVLLDGTIELGRMLDTQGAHVSGHNANNIGICYIGGKTSDMKESKDTRTDKQKISIHFLLMTLRLMYKDIPITGHNNFEGVAKTCPGFDAKKAYAYLS